MTQKKIIDFDEMFEPKAASKKQSTPAKAKLKTLPSFDVRVSKISGIKQKTYKHDDDDKLAKDKLGYDVKVKLNYYVKKTPQYNILVHQINQLVKERAVYEKNNDFVNVDKCEKIITELKLNLEDFQEIFKKGSIKKEIVKSSPKLEDLNKKRKHLTLAIKESSTNDIMKTLILLKKQLDFYEKASETDYSDILDFDDLESVENFNPSNEKETPEVYQDYLNHCGKIASIIDWTPDEVMESPNDKIKKALDDVLRQKWEDYKEELNALNFQIQEEKDIISGETKLTDILYDSFDFTKNEGKVPKEILAATHIGLVKAIAYNVCVAKNKLNLIDDIIGAGLFGLTEAINKWYELQLMKDSALTFKGFANLRIRYQMNLEMNRLIFGMTGVSGTKKANDDHYKNRKVNDFIKYNRGFADIDRDIVTNILQGWDTSIETHKAVTSETDFVGAVGGEESVDDADIWANLNTSDDNQEELMEAKHEYERMLSSITKLLDLFEIKSDAQGAQKVTDKKLFDVYDRKIFLMTFGLQPNYNKQTNIDDTDDAKRRKSINEYTQDEIRSEVTKLMKINGDLAPNANDISQPAISARWKNIEKKLKFAIERYPELKTGFEYFVNVRNMYNDETGESEQKWSYKNREVFDKMNNAREELYIKNDRDFLRNIYSDNDKVLNIEMSDHTRLGDVVHISDTNPLDDEIASLFSDFD